MNRDDIIRMAREAGFDPHDMSDDFTCNLMNIERFAALVAAAERERIKWDTIHSCHPECDKPVCVAMRKAVLEEREACAKVAEDMGNIDGNMNKTWRNGCFDTALAIRERGAP